MKHKHHIIPRHMGGTDNPENLKSVTIEEHALEHQKLWKMYNKLQDFMAWKMLSGKTDEAEKARVVLAKEGFKKFMLSDTFDEWKETQRINATGHKQSEETKSKRSASLIKAYEEGRKEKTFLRFSKKWFRENCIKNQDLLINGRKHSKKWRESVSSESKRNLARINSPTSKKVIIDNITYNSIREASSKTDFSYYKLLQLSSLKTKDERVVFI